MTPGSRRRVKRWSGAMMALAIAPIIVVVAPVKALEGHSYPPRDIRNEPFFWVVLALLAIGFASALVVGSLRVVRDQRPRA